MDRKGNCGLSEINGGSSQNAGYRSFLERLGYDKAAHDSGAGRKRALGCLAIDHKAGMAVHIAEIVAAILLIAVKLLYF